MNKTVKTILTTAAMALATGCVTAGTWVNGCYIDGPLCTVCDGTRIVVHTYGTTVCAHCDGTGIEPPEETFVANTVVVDTWCPPPPPRRHGHRPVFRPNRHRHVDGRPQHRTTREPAPRKQFRPTVGPTDRAVPAKGGRRRGGGRR